ncbi:MAG TPA: hypothetical protein V6C71_12660 [Coleofasciculaceae cyanobacterium]|jgi:hypothetical protein
MRLFLAISFIITYVYNASGLSDILWQHFMAIALLDLRKGAYIRVTLVTRI